MIAAFLVFLRIFCVTMEDLEREFIKTQKQVSRFIKTATQQTKQIMEYNERHQKVIDKERKRIERQNAVMQRKQDREMEIKHAQSKFVVGDGVRRLKTTSSFARCGAIGIIIRIMNNKLTVATLDQPKESYPQNISNFDPFALEDSIRARIVELHEHTKKKKATAPVYESKPSMNARFSLPPLPPQTATLPNVSLPKTEASFSLSSSSSSSINSHYDIKASNGARDLAFRSGIDMQQIYTILKQLKMYNPSAGISVADVQMCIKLCCK